ncbi:MAG: hypothetical protein GKS01_04240 [Alphaproteobacteria bacterium]|nr:hypothetical protein [Alphaproteobacteria bacterium]
MADLEGLKQRIELIDARLKTAHVARERESAALSDIWEQIRERYLDQMTEIDSMRQQIHELEETKDELTKLIHALLAAIETNLSHASDETVPQIKAMADALLETPSAAIETATTENFSPIESAELLDEPLSKTLENDLNETDDLISAIEDTLDDEDLNEIADASNNIERGEQTAALSPGIRDLIGRIEEAVGPVTLEGDESVSTPADKIDELGKDLQEIEELRGELMGLRERITSNG